MAELPPLAPVPPPAVRRTLQHAEWEACVDAWIMLLGVRIESSDKAFKENAPKDESAVLFLSSFYHQLATSGESGLHTGQNARQLRKLCFLLTRRLLLDVSLSPPELLHWKFLGGMCCCYPSSSALKRLLSDAWDKHQETITSSLEKAKLSIIKQLSIATSTVNPEIVSDIRLLTILASALPACGQVLITGSDFLDTFSDAYLTLKRGEVRKVLVANAYVGLTSLLKGSKPNLSLLLDQLFGLKAAAGVGTAKMKKEPTLLSDLICSSDLLARLERYLSVQTQQRGQDLLSSLRSYQTESKPFHHRYQKQKKKLDKGKSRAPDVPGADAELHAHRMSLVTQVQDLFPDLGSGYIVRLLDFYGDNTETVVAHLLDASLPLELQNLDISEQLPPTHTTTDHDTLLPRPTPPEIPSPEPTPARKNVFDEDVDIAELARSGDDAAREKLRFGRANPDLTADAVLADRSQHATNKAAILSALAAFDSDDDERDDTYDVADVGGTIDSVPAGTDADADADKRNRSAEEADMSLFRAYKSNPALFARDSATRRSQPRASLKRETGMTDEAIEGWAVMLTRDPKRLSKLEDKLALGSGGPGGVMTQPELAPTSYRKPTQAEGESDDDDQPSGPSFRGDRGGSGRGRGRGGQRGRGGGGGRRGGNVNGPTGDPGTTASRQRKEENKSSRANHNRRQQRAKKIARGGGLPG